MTDDDALRFGFAVVLVVAVDLLTSIVAVQQVLRSLITRPALALHAAFVRSAVTAPSSLGHLAPLVAVISTFLGLYLLSRWRWERA